MTLIYFESEKSELMKETRDESKGEGSLSAERVDYAE